MTSLPDDKFWHLCPNGNVNRPYPSVLCSMCTPAMIAVKQQRVEAADQPAPLPGAEVVADALLADIQKRVDKGLKTYGTKLMTFNGRSALRDLYEELLDAVFYLKQLLMEEDENHRVRSD